MNSTLKAAGHIGAELGAAKAKVERLAYMLRYVKAKFGSAMADSDIEAIDAAITQQPVHSPWTEDSEGMDSSKNQYTAADMATAAAQGFRDGQAAVEPAPAQDERTAFEAWVMQHNTAVREDYDDTDENAPEDIRLDRQGGVYIWANAEAAWFAWKARSALGTRPAQTEQEPIQVTAVAVMRDDGDGGLEPDWLLEGGTAELMAGMVLVVAEGDITGDEGHGEVYAAPIAQTAPRCQCCGYLVTDSEHRGCLRAATPSPAMDSQQ